ncbi:DUF2855 family protein [Sulfitobacter aestuariivivens]|uniref:DUF2855 family protein n=1 Tax=Sulfitobacter aestuariivivens TaxID=2766981 RepID=A0A927D4L1_9RHOB|nr:DUF2855 family protein [Sulfitobacter aestuariivivens]MBD3663317.1 DUF2855 family protein [Sulfitobacter aestuariivivens]
MQQLLIDQNAITRTRLENVTPPALAEGQSRLRLQSFALTANNVTYAASGFAIGYWQFFPSGTEGHGLVPVWGTAEVVESHCSDLPVGKRLYGFYPLAEELVITPRQTSGGAIVDTADHRAQLPAVYNRYMPVRENTPGEDHLRALLQPLLATSWLLADWLRDNGFFGAKQVIVGSASSKTGLGLCKYLSEDQDHPVQIVGLTSAGNLDFVKGLNACDQVLSYDQIDDIAKVPSVYVDMSGNGEVKLALHAALADHLKHSAAVGISHWDKFAPKQDLPGVKPQFFFAPAQIAKRRKEWGPGVVEREITTAWQRIAADAADWMDVTVHKGLPAAEPVYAALAAGRADPAQGHVVTLT